MEQINTIDKISAVYRNTAEEARQELNKVQQKIYRIGRPAPAAICGRSSRNYLFLERELGYTGLHCPHHPTAVPIFNEIPQPAVPSQGLSRKEDGNQRAGTRRSGLRYVFFR